MLTAQRRQVIHTELQRTGRVIATELAQRFGLSEDTIRRDLRQMAAEGVCQRVYGGAVAPYAGTLKQRNNHLRAEKDRLAKVVAGLVSPGQTLIVDAGSTNSAIARMLPENHDLTVITNAPDIASYLVTRPDISLVVLGGSYDPDIGACLGPQTRAALHTLRADWLFLGSCGLDAENGVTAFDQGEAAVKIAMAKISTKIAAAVTTEKVGTAAPYRVLATAGLDILISEKNPALESFQRADVIIKTP